MAASTCRASSFAPVKISYPCPRYLPKMDRCSAHAPVRPQSCSSPCFKARAACAGIPGPRTQDYTRQVEPQLTQNPNLVYKAKSYPNTTATDPENVQPLNGKQQGVLDVEGAASPVRPLL
jgi:hypothetical protein